jgi:hypothetical protein
MESSHQSSSSSSDVAPLVAMSNKEESDWVESVADVAQTCKKLFSANACRLCDVYTDAQVEYEVRQEKQPQPKYWMHMMSHQPSLEVELYRQFLFDEDSVMEVVSEREKEMKQDENEDHSTITQRTQ